MKSKHILTKIITLFALLLLSLTNYSQSNPQGDGFFIDGVYEVLNEPNNVSLVTMFHTLITDNVFVYPDFASIDPSWANNLSQPFKVNCDFTDKNPKVLGDFYAASLYKPKTNACILGRAVVQQLKAVAKKANKTAMVLPIISGNASILRNHSNQELQQLATGIAVAVNSSNADGIGFDLEGPSLGCPPDGKACKAVIPDQPTSSIKNDAQFIKDVVDALKVLPNQPKYVALFDGEHILARLQHIGADLSHIILLRSMYDMEKAPSATPLDPVTLDKYKPDATALTNLYDQSQYKGLNVQFVAPASATNRIFGVLASFNQLYLQYPTVKDTSRTKTVPSLPGCLKGGLQTCFSDNKGTLQPYKKLKMKPYLFESYPMMCWQHNGTPKTPITENAQTVTPYPCPHPIQESTQPEMAKLFNGQVDFDLGRKKIPNTQFYALNKPDFQAYLQTAFKAYKDVKKSAQFLNIMGVVLYSLRPIGFHAMDCSKKLFSTYGDSSMSNLCIGRYPEQITQESLNTYTKSFSNKQ